MLLTYGSKITAALRGFPATAWLSCYKQLYEAERMKQKNIGLKSILQRESIAEATLAYVRTVIKPTLLQVYNILWQFWYSVVCHCIQATVSGRVITMIQQQQTIPADQLPRGVESVSIGYSYYGRPRVMVTLQQKPRRQLMVFGIILLVFAPLVLVFTSVCIALRHYYLAYSYAAGVLVSTRSFMVFACHLSTEIKQIQQLIQYCTFNHS